MALVTDGMRVGLGTGSTVSFLLGPLASRGLDLECVATSPATERQALELGLNVVSFSGEDAPARLDIAIDGADQVAADGWVVKGGGGAHTREKAVAAAAERFVVIVSSDKLVLRLEPPIPLELAEYGLAATLARLQTARVRGAPLSPDGGVVADYLGEVGDPATLSVRLSCAPGVIDHGLFPPEMVDDVLIGHESGVEHRHVSSR